MPLAPFQEGHKRPRVIILVGLPASGKSTWRNAFAGNAVVCSQDDLVEHYADHQGLTYTEAFRKADLKLFERQVKQEFADAIAQGRDIVLDRTNVSKKSRAIFLNMVPDHYQKIAIWFDCDPVLLDYRLARRAKLTGKFIPPFVIRDMRRNFQMPDTEEFDEVWHVGAEEPGWFMTFLRVKAWIKQTFWR